MKVEFLWDVFNAGTKIYAAGKQYDGDLERYVRRGDAKEVKGGKSEGTDGAAQVAAAGTKDKDKGKEGK